MKNNIPKEIWHKGKAQTEEDFFISRCDYYANKEENNTRKNWFIKKCAEHLTGINGQRMWSSDEKETNLNIFKEYFPDKIDDLLELEKEINARNERVKANKQKFLQMQNDKNL